MRARAGGDMVMLDTIRKTASTWLSTLLVGEQAQDRRVAAGARDRIDAGFDLLERLRRAEVILDSLGARSDRQRCVRGRQIRDVGAVLVLPVEKAGAPHVARERLDRGGIDRPGPFAR